MGEVPQLSPDEEAEFARELAAIGDVSEGEDEEEADAALGALEGKVVEWVPSSVLHEMHAYSASTYSLLQEEEEENEQEVGGEERHLESSHESRSPTSTTAMAQLQSRMAEQASKFENFAFELADFEASVRQTVNAKVGEEALGSPQTQSGLDVTAVGDPTGNGDVASVESHSAEQPTQTPCSPGKTAISDLDASDSGGVRRWYEERRQADQEWRDAEEARTRERQRKRQEQQEEQRRMREEAVEKERQREEEIQREQQERFAQLERELQREREDIEAQMREEQRQLEDEAMRMSRMEEERRILEQQQQAERESRERKRVEKLRSLVEMEVQSARRQLSASKIARMFKGYTLRKQYNAATRVQCAWRMCVARVHVLKLRQERDAYQGLHHALTHSGPREMQAAYQTAMALGLSDSAAEAKQQFERLTEAARDRLETTSESGSIDEWMAAKKDVARFDLIEEQEAGERRFSNRVNKIRKALKDLVKGGDRDELERTGQEAIVVLGIDKTYVNEAVAAFENHCEEVAQLRHDLLTAAEARPIEEVRALCMRGKTLGGDVLFEELDNQAQKRLKERQVEATKKLNAKLEDMVITASKTGDVYCASAGYEAIDIQEELKAARELGLEDLCADAMHKTKALSDIALEELRAAVHDGSMRDIHRVCSKAQAFGLATGVQQAQEQVQERTSKILSELQKVVQRGDSPSDEESLQAYLIEGNKLELYEQTQATSSAIERQKSLRLEAQARKAKEDAARIILTAWKSFGKSVIEAKAFREARRKRQRSAALRLQKVWRGWRVRVSGQLDELRLQARHAAAEETRRRLLMKRKANAAICIQAFARGYLVRKRIAKAKAQVQYYDDDDFEYDEVDVDDFLGGLARKTQINNNDFELYIPDHLLQEASANGDNIAVSKIQVEQSCFEEASFRNARISRNSTSDLKGDRPPYSEMPSSSEVFSLQSTLPSSPRPERWELQANKPDTVPNWNASSGSAYHSARQAGSVDSPASSCSQSGTGNSIHSSNLQKAKREDQMKQISSDWGFKDEKTAELFMKKKQKLLKQKNAKAFRTKMQDPQQRLERFRRAARADTRVSQTQKQYGVSLAKGCKGPEVPLQHGRVLMGSQEAGEHPSSVIGSFASSSEAGENDNASVISAPSDILEMKSTTPNKVGKSVRSQRQERDSKTPIQMINNFVVTSPWSGQPQ